MDEILNRCDTLLKEALSFPKKRKESYYHYGDMTQKLQKWILSVCNLISIIVPKNNLFYIESQKLLSDKNLNDLIPYHVTERLTGLLESFRDELQLGLLKNLEYMIMATTFDDFLDHAEHFHKGGKQQESAVLVSVVFEDTLRKIAKKNSMEEKGISLETIIDELAKINVITPVKAKRIKGFGAVRNKALHAQWSEFDLRDVGDLIRGTKELIEML